MTIPYTYLLKFLPTAHVYYGVRFREGCHPNELFKTYFSSSKTVKTLIEHYGANSFEYTIRKTFNNKKDAVIWEQKVLLRIKAAEKHFFLNKSNNMKGIIRGVGNYNWVYNNQTKKRILLLKGLPIPVGFNIGKGPEKIFGKIIISNIITKKEKRIYKNEIIPNGFIKGRLRKGATSGTRWILNVKTKERKLLKNNEQLPIGWEFKSINLKNKGKIIYKDGITKRIKKEELNDYLKNGWNIGNLSARGYKKIFYLSDDKIIDKKIVKKDQVRNYEQLGWFVGDPDSFYKVFFNDGRILCYPVQWFKKNMDIPYDMLFYSSKNFYNKNGGFSIKYKWLKVQKIKIKDNANRE